MTSYHDLEDQTYRSVIAEKITRIYGPPTWRTKEIFKDELTKIAMKHKVSYGWSGNFGLLALVLGAARHAINHPTLAAFVRPNQPPDSPNYPNNASSVVIKNITDAFNVTKRNYAVLMGFVEGFRR